MSTRPFRVRAVVAVMYAVTALVVLASACSTLAPKPPPNLTPQVQAQFYATYIIKDFDVIRDFADDASKTVPPIISRETLLTIVDWHSSVVKVIHASPGGWRSAAAVGLDQLKVRLAPSDYQKFRPYVAAARAFIQEGT